MKLLKKKKQNNTEVVKIMSYKILKKEGSKIIQVVLNNDSVFIIGQIVRYQFLGFTYTSRIQEFDFPYGRDFVCCATMKEHGHENIPLDAITCVA